MLEDVAVVVRRRKAFGLRITFCTFPGKTYRPMYQCASMLVPKDWSIPNDIVFATNSPSPHSRNSRARNRRTNGPASSWSSMTIGLACWRSAAVNCDLRETLIGIGSRGFGGSVWVYSLSSNMPTHLWGGRGRAEGRAAKTPVVLEARWTMS